MHRPVFLLNPHPSIAFREERETPLRTLRFFRDLLILWMRGYKLLQIFKRRALHPFMHHRRPTK